MSFLCATAFGSEWGPSRDCAEAGRDTVEKGGLAEIGIGRLNRGDGLFVMAAIDRFVTPGEFKTYETIARAKGFLMVSASPLTRSSYHADSDFEKLRTAREAKLVSG